MRLPYTFLVLLLFSLNACQKSTIVQDMVKLDKALVPVWYAIKTNNMNQAQRANFVLHYRWQEFDRKYYSIEKENEDWIEGFRRVKDWLCDMTISIEMNNAESAAVQLDHVVYEIMDFRYRNKIPYYMDNLWDFEFATNEFTDIVNDPMIDLLEWCEVKERVGFFNYHWNKLQKNNPEFDLWKWEQEDITEYSTLVQKLDKQIKQLNSTLECADTKLIAKSLLRIEYQLLQVFTLFGDFESTKTHYATR